MTSMKSTDQPIIVEANISIDEETLWGAITEQPQMIQWFFEEIPDFEPKEGFNTRFDVKTPNSTFPHQWTILEVVPLEKIVYDWRYEGFKGIGIVTFELSSTKGGSAIKLTSEVIEDFEEGVEEFKSENCLAGWQYFIQERLVSYLS